MYPSFNVQYLTRDNPSPRMLFSMYHFPFLPIRSVFVCMQLNKKAIIIIIITLTYVSYHYDQPTFQ